MYKQAVGAWDAFGELAEEGDPGVDVDALAETGVHDCAVLLGLTGIPHSEKRCVLRVELRPEIEAAFLDPALEIAWRDFVGATYKRVRGLEYVHPRIFVCDI